MQRESGVLVLDDTTLDKPHARKMELVTRHWSGKHRRVVPGINLLTLLWTDVRALIPCDFRVYDKPLSGKNKNGYFREMTQAAHARRFRPGYILIESCPGTETVLRSGEMPGPQSPIATEPHWDGGTSLCAFGDAQATLRGQLV